MKQHEKYLKINICPSSQPISYSSLGLVLQIMSKHSEFKSKTRGIAQFLPSHTSVWSGSKIRFPNATSLPKIFPKLVVLTPEKLTVIQALYC